MLRLPTCNRAPCSIFIKSSLQAIRHEVLIRLALTTDRSPILISLNFIFPFSSTTVPVGSVLFSRMVKVVWERLQNGVSWGGAGPGRPAVVRAPCRRRPRRPRPPVRGPDHCHGLRPARRSANGRVPLRGGTTGQAGAHAPVGRGGGHRGRAGLLGLEPGRTGSPHPPPESAHELRHTHMRIRHLLGPGQVGEVAPGPDRQRRQIGRASCRERV